MPSDVSDFNLYGGLYRYVNLVYVPEVSLEYVHVETLSVTAEVAEIRVKARLYNPNGVKRPLLASVTIFAPEGKPLFRKEVSIEPGQGFQELARLSVPNPELWHTDAPKLYKCKVDLHHPQQGWTTGLEERFGLRFFEFVHKGPFKLNGERSLLRGTHRHEDHAGLAAAMTEELIRKEMALIKEMGVNFIRLGHYQQSRIVLELCDELGILVWEEIPWCRGGIGGERYRRQCRDMLTAMIEQHYNHPSVILWGWATRTIGRRISTPSTRKRSAPS
ncbi:hypothetical protein LJK88_01600 [Paenibacillus sp. P26]|nr:hypothetical protein LJK88_01600 [Paenibacillus sp. P26]